MEVIEATCGTERVTECKIVVKDDYYALNINNTPFVKNQQIFGLGFYEEKALRNCLKKVKDKEIVQQIKEQFRV